MEPRRQPRQWGAGHLGMPPSHVDPRRQSHFTYTQPAGSHGGRRQMRTTLSNPVPHENSSDSSDVHLVISPVCSLMLSYVSRRN